MHTKSVQSRADRPLFSIILHTLFVICRIAVPPAELRFANYDESPLSLRKRSAFDFVEPVVRRMDPIAQ